MWYVIQTRSGREQYVKRLVERTVCPSCYKEVFIPRYEAMKRYRGEWIQRTFPLIPGYLFVITSDVNQLATELRQVPALTKLLGNEDMFTPLSNEEAAFVDKFTSNAHRVVNMSEGIIEGDRIVVLKGPLMNQEALIKRIDRHKRLAYLEVEILGRRKTVKAGLEIVRKRRQPE